MESFEINCYHRSICSVKWYSRYPIGILTHSVPSILATTAAAATRGQTQVIIGVDETNPGPEVQLQVGCQKIGPWVRHRSGAGRDAGGAGDRRRLPEDDRQRTGLTGFELSNCWLCWKPNSVLLLLMDLYNQHPYSSLPANKQTIISLQ